MNPFATSDLLPVMIKLRDALAEWETLFDELSPEGKVDALMVASQIIRREASHRHNRVASDMTPSSCHLVDALADGYMLVRIERTLNRLEGKPPLYDRKGAAR
jgi:hypothetical protein